MRVILTSAFIVAVICSSQVLAGTRVLRDTEIKDSVDPPSAAPAAASEDKKGGPDPDHLRTTLTRALSTLRKHASEQLTMDVDKFQSALDSGSLDSTLEKVREDLRGNGMDIRKLIDAFRNQATGDYQEVISRVASGASSVLDRIHAAAEERRHSIRDHAKAALDAVGEVLGEKN